MHDVLVCIHKLARYSMYGFSCGQLPVVITFDKGRSHSVKIYHLRPEPGFEPGTSSTQRRNHTTRPFGLLLFSWRKKRYTIIHVWSAVVCCDAKGILPYHFLVDTVTYSNLLLETRRKRADYGRLWVGGIVSSQV